MIGADCDIRENVTMNIGTEDGGGVTTVGDRCFFMVGSMSAHDCHVGNDVTFANNAVLGGHVVVGDHVVLGGQVAVHQFVRIGEGAMIGGVSGVPPTSFPFGFAIGFARALRRPQHRRHEAPGLSRGTTSGGSGAPTGRCSSATATFDERRPAVEREFGGDPLVGKIVDFIRAPRHRAADDGGAVADRSPPTPPTRAHEPGADASRVAARSPSSAAAAACR